MNGPNDEDYGTRSNLVFTHLLCSDEILKKQRNKTMLLMESKYRKAVIEQSCPFLSAPLSMP